MYELLTSRFYTSLLQISYINAQNLWYGLLFWNSWKCIFMSAINPQHRWLMIWEYLGQQETHLSLCQHQQQQKRAGAGAGRSFSERGPQKSEQNFLIRTE